MHNADTNANHQSRGGRSLYRTLERGVNNIQNRRSKNFMERCLECDRGSWFAKTIFKGSVALADADIGPAHAVYFGTYEVVKEFAGGNAEDGKHHPGAAGSLWLPRLVLDIDADFPAALSGACATIASDALMNPFDGKTTSFSSCTTADLVKS